MLTVVSLIPKILGNLISFSHKSVKESSEQIYLACIVLPSLTGDVGPHKISEDNSGEVTSVMLLLENSDSETGISYDS